MFFVIWFLELYEVWLLSNKADFIVRLMEIGSFTGVSILSRRRYFNMHDAIWCPTLGNFGGQGRNESVVKKVSVGDGVGPSAVHLPDFLQTVDSGHQFSHAAHICGYLLCGKL